MFTYYFEAGGPVMYAVLAAWVVVLAAILDRLLCGVGMLFRRPTADFEAERRRASRGVARIDAVSQIATSLGLFGTVLGIAEAFLARGGSLGTDAAQVLASGLTTALFTTVAGLIVFLFGQGFLIVWNEWLDARERASRDLLERAARAQGRG